MALYRVKNGHRHGACKQYGPGSLVELSDSEAAGFLDKLEKVEESPAPQPKVKAYSVIDSTGVTWGDLDPAVIDRLVSAGYGPFTALAASDEELLAVDGIGPATLRKVRKALNGDKG